MRVIELFEDDLLVFIVLVDVREMLFATGRSASQLFAHLVFIASIDAASDLLSLCATEKLWDSRKGNAHNLARARLQHEKTAESTETANSQPDLGGRRTPKPDYFMLEQSLLVCTHARRTRDWIVLQIPGVLLSITVGMAATFVSNVYGGPTVLFALLLGMAFNFISAESRFAPGIAFSSRSILRIGVALLGARITFEQIVGLGWQTMLGVACAVILTIVFGLICASIMGLSKRFGVLTAGAVAICGASAAAAIAAVLPRSVTHECDTAFTIIGVTALSTIAMVLYPLVAAIFHFTHAQTGVFLGGTIHDVAQVVGAGYAVSQESGDVATIIKLLRVALLVPAVVAISLLSRGVDMPEGGKRPALIPLFLVAFIGIVLLNSAHLVSAAVQTLLGEASRWCIVIAIAALGIKTSLVALSQVGPRAIWLMVTETVFIALFVLLLVHIG